MESVNQHSTRRGFLTKILFAWGAATVLPIFYGILKYINPPSTARHGVQNLAVMQAKDIPSDAPVITKINKQAIIVLRDPVGQIKAFSAKCTHLGCIVQYQADRKIFHCNCHGSEFSLDGKNIAGPAPSPLVPYRVELKSDSVVVSDI